MPGIKARQVLYPLYYLSGLPLNIILVLEPHMEATPSSVLVTIPGGAGDHVVLWLEPQALAHEACASAHGGLLFAAVYPTSR